MRTLLIMPHLDDEAISCGGLIQYRRMAVDDVAIMTIYGRVYDYGQESVSSSIDAELQDATDAASILGSPRQMCLNMNEGEPSQVGYYKVLKEIEGFLSQWEPDEVVGPSADDVNQDHRFLAHVLGIALRPGNLGRVKRRLEFIALDGNVRQPNYFVRMSEEVLDRKIAAVAAYRREAREGNSPRSPENIRAMARVWGAACNARYAEGYRLVFQRE